MATTPKWALRYPVGGDAPQGNVQLQNLGLDLENLALPQFVSVPAAGVAGREYTDLENFASFVSNGATLREIFQYESSDLGVWKRYPGPCNAGVVLVNSAAATLYVGGVNRPGQTPNSFTGQAVSSHIFRLNPTDVEWNVLRPADMRIRAIVLTNDTAFPTVLTVGLHSLTSITAGTGGGSGGTANFNNTASGNTVSITNPATQALTLLTGSPFTVPAAGTYGLCCRSTLAAPANACVYVLMELQIRYP